MGQLGDDRKEEKLAKNSYWFSGLDGLWVDIDLET
jgi:hypothetical protein